MDRKLKRNAGFSLIELIIVVAIMAVLAGIVAPQYLKYVERSKRVTDVTTAKQICDAYERVAAIENYVESVGVPAGYIPIGIFTWDKDTPLPTNPTDLNEAVLMELGKIPVSAIDDDCFWLLFYNANTGSVLKIYLTGSGSFALHELYPDPSNFLENGLN